MTNGLKIAIVGVGPVGGILGAHMLYTGHHIVLCDILRDHLDAIRNQGMVVTGVAELSCRCATVAYSIAELRHFPEIDAIMVCTKASALPDIVPQIARTAGPETWIICNQNGLDNEDFIAETFGPDRVLRIVPNYAGDRTGRGRFWMSFFNPPNYIGAMGSAGEPLARELAEALTQAGLETHFTTEIKLYEWKKAILNAAMASVCALTRKTMREMMDFPPTEYLVEQLMREGIEVAQALGLTIGEDFFEDGIRYLQLAGYHKPSMLQDIERGLTTEIAWINGKIVEWGQRCGMETPYNRAVVALVSALEKKSAVPEEPSERS